MHHLDLERAPYWLELGAGVSVEVLPYGTEVDLRAHDLPEGLREELGKGDLAAKSAGLIKAFGRAAIIGWKGVAVTGRDTEEPWPEGIDALLSAFPFGRNFQERYVMPALRLVSEKNASAPSPAGTSAVAETIAVPAPSDARPAPTEPKPH